MDNQDLAGLPEDVREHVANMDARNTVNGSWNAIRAELLRLARENAELLHLPDRIRGLREAEAELAALKRKIAGAETIVFPAYKSRVHEWCELRECVPCGQRVALLPVGGE